MKYLLFLIFFLYSFSTYSLNDNFFLTGKKHYEEKKFDKAKMEFEKSITFNPKFVDSYVYLAKIFLQIKNLDEEKKNLQTALMLDPKNEEALYLIVQLFIKESDFKNAEKNYHILSSVCSKLCNKLPFLKTSIGNFKG